MHPHGSTVPDVSAPAPRRQSTPERAPEPSSDDADGVAESSRDLLRPDIATLRSMGIAFNRLARARDPSPGKQRPERDDARQDHEPKRDWRPGDSRIDPIDAARQEHQRESQTGRGVQLER